MEPSGTVSALQSLYVGSSGEQCNVFRGAELRVEAAVLSKQRPILERLRQVQKNKPAEGTYPI